jgi:hypothetical protein
MKHFLFALIAVLLSALFASEASAMTIQIGRVTKDSLTKTCTAMGGEMIGFNQPSAYGCVRRNCDGKGNNCSIHCNKTGCYGHTPDAIVATSNSVSGVLGARPASTLTGGGLLSTEGAGSMPTGGPTAGGAPARAPAAAPAGGLLK